MRPWDARHVWQLVRTTVQDRVVQRVAPGESCKTRALVRGVALDVDWGAFAEPACCEALHAQPPQPSNPRLFPTIEGRGNSVDRRPT